MNFVLITICFYLCAAHQENQNFLKEFSIGNNLFTASIYKEIIKGGNKNILVSPLSAQIILALSQSGAKDETKEEVRSTLRLPSTEEKIKSSFKKLLTVLKSGDQYKLQTANKIYVKQGLPVEQNFTQLARKIYNADLENIDFTRQNDAANAINQWVEKQTERKIKDLVDPTDLDDMTTLILVNALYFRGRWAKPFNQLSTKKRKFYRTKDDVIEVDTMFLNRKTLGYYESQELKAKFAEMYFENDQVSMVIVLPDDKDGLAELESKIEQVFTPRRFGVQKLNLALPKFQINSKTDFKEILEKLGVHTAFSNQADFSNISGKKGDLHVSKIIQKAFIDVNEEGVEATVATDLGFMLGSTMRKHKKFIVDHPFIYYIRANDVILFAGKVSDPSWGLYNN